LKVILVGPSLEEQLSEPGSYVPGRASQAQIRLDCTSVSRRHAVLVIRDDAQSAWIEDPGSSNGTSVNGAAVERSRFSDGDLSMES